MKLLRRNTTEFEYWPFSGSESDLNENDEHTGEFHPTYGTPVTYRGNISVPSGRADQTFYGKDVRYTHVLVMDNPKADIAETGLVRWKGAMYDITAVRPSLNVLSVALREQTTTVPEEGLDETVDAG